MFKFYYKRYDYKPFHDVYDDKKGCWYYCRTISLHLLREGALYYNLYEGNSYNSRRCIFLAFEKVKKSGIIKPYICNDTYLIIKPEPITGMKWYARI